jgi:hypothetical protein
MCQHKSTSFCVDDASKGEVTDQFCVNGGTCNDIVNTMASHPGCSCHRRWEGSHCEFEKGILFDDALDFFQQRQTEISNQKRSVDVVVATSLVAQAEESKLYILYIVSACMVAIATALFFLFRTKKMKAERPVSDDVHFLNEHIGFESIENSSNANLSPRAHSQDEDIDPWSSYGHSTSSYAPIDHLNDIDVVETLDDDTARMIEARLEKSSGHSLVTKGKEEDLDNDDDNERIIANNNFAVECQPHNARAVLTRMAMT